MSELRRGETITARLEPGSRILLKYLKGPEAGRQRRWIIGGDCEIEQVITRAEEPASWKAGWERRKSFIKRGEEIHNEKRRK